MLQPGNVLAIVVSIPLMPLINLIFKSNDFLQFQYFVAMETIVIKTGMCFNHISAYYCGFVLLNKKTYCIP